MFQRHDPEVPTRALEWGGGLIVGGRNYGQGSSRELVALGNDRAGLTALRT
jgi:aconitate hydratase